MESFETTNMTEQSQFFDPQNDPRLGQFFWSQDNMDKAFFSDPLNVIQNPQVFRAAYGNNQIGDDELRSHIKKALVSEWYVKKFRLHRDIVQHGFDEITRQVFGKDTSVDDIYNTIREARRKEINQNKGFFEKSARAISGGVANLEKTLSDTARVMVPDALETMNILINNTVTSSLEWLAETTNMPKVAEWARQNNWLNAPAGEKNIYQKTSDILKQHSQNQADFAAAQAEIHGNNLYYGVLQNLPQLLFIVGTAHIQSGAMAAKAATTIGQVPKAVSITAPMMATGSFASEWADTEGMPYNQRVLNALAVGGAEWLFEQNFGVGRLFNKYWNKAIPQKEIVKLSETFGANLRRTVKSIGIDAAVEGLEEVGTGITQRFSNLLFGKDGKTLRSMSLSDIAYHLLSPVPMEFGVGMISGGIMGTAGIHARYGNKLAEARNINFNADRISSARQRLQQLQEIANPTDEQVAQMEFLEKNIAEHNYNALWNDEFEEFKKKFKQQQEDNLTDEEWTEQRTNEGLQKAREIQSLEYERTSEKTLEALDLSIRSIVNALELKDVDIQLVRTVRDLPDHLQKRKDIDGVFDGSSGRPMIYLVAENLDAGRVKKVILHEAVGHQGLRNVFGESFNDFLRQIGSQYTAEVQRVARRYNLDLKNDAKYLEAVDEFLAEKASQGVPDGSFWQKICAAFRQYLRNMGLNIAYSDNDIQELFRQSLRSLQRNGDVGSSGSLRNLRGVRYALFDNTEKSDLIFDALQKIVNGSAEETVSNLRNDLDQYGGTNDITFYWGDEKKGIYHIAYRRGIDTLFHVIDTVADGKINRFVEGNKTVVLEKDGYEAVLALTEHNQQKSWLLTGWKTNKPDEISEFSTQSDPTQLKPTFSRQELGAGLDKIISQLPENASGNSEKSGTFKSPGENVRFSIRQEPPPQKTLKAYKVFAVFKKKPGQLFPPMVANPGGASTPVGVWLNADAAPRAEDSKTGRPRVQAGGSGTNAGKQTLAYRPGWHLGEVPQANQFNRINPETGEKELFPENFIWAECEIAADENYQQEAESYGYNAAGNFQHSLAGLPRLPENGFYKYRTNPDPKTEPWFITGAMKVNRLLTDAEINEILQQNGYPAMRRKGGEMNLEDWGFNKDGSLEADNNGNVRFSVAPQVDTPEFKNWFGDSKVVDENGKPLVVYHGTDRYGFTVFRDDSHFTADYDYAKRYANKGRKDTESGVYAVYLSIQNPFDIRNPDDRKIFTEYRQGHIPAETKTGAMDWAEYDYEDFREYLQENYPQKYDGIILDEGGDADNAHRGIAYVPFYPTQIKSATDNVGTFDQNNPDIRFSVEEQRIDSQKKEAWAKSLTRIAHPVYTDFGAAEDYLRRQGIDYLPDRDGRTLSAALAIARDAVRQRNNRRRKAADLKFMQKKDDFFKILSQKYGEDFKINAGENFDGQTFTGSWMDKRKTQKARTDSVKAEDAAKLLTEKLGKEISADLVVEHFAHLKKDALLSELRAARKDKRRLAELAAMLEEEDRMEQTNDVPFGNKDFVETPDMAAMRKAYTQKQAKYRKEQYELWKSENLPQIYQWVMNYLQKGQKIKPTMRFAGEDFEGDMIPRAWKTYSRNNPGKKTGKALADYNARRDNALKYSEGMNSDELAQALANLYGGDAVQIENDIIDFFRDWKDSDSYREFIDDRINQEKDIQDQQNAFEAQTAAESFRNLFEQAQMDKADLQKTLMLVNQHIRKYIPEAMQGEFLSDVIKLGSFSTSPSVQYPQGRREFELDKLLRKIHSFNAKNRILDLLSGTKVRVNQKGIPISNYGENSEIINKIKSIVKLPVFDVENKLAQLAEEIAQVESGTKEGNIAELRSERGLYDMFGRLDLRTPEQLQGALAELRKLMDQNKDSLFYRLKNIKDENAVRNRKIIQEITGTETYKVPSQVHESKEKLSKFLLQNRGLKSLFNLVTAKSGKDFNDTELGKLFTELEDATYKGAAMDRVAMENASDRMYEMFNLKTIHDRRKFYEMINEQQKSGIIVKRYQGEVVDYFDPDSEMEITHFNDRRNYLKGKISVKSARKLLSDYEAGKIKDADPVGIELLRQQLSDFDLGIERVYNVFGNDDQNEIWHVLTQADRNTAKTELEKSKKLLYIKPLNAALEAKTVTEQELELSIVEAANILMAWEQPDVQAKMRWNGWSDTSIDQLKKFIGPQWVEYAYFLRSEIAENSKTLNDLAQEIYGVGLPGIENYFPTSYKASQIRGIGKSSADGIVGDTYGTMSVNPDFLIARKFHMGEIDLHQSILDVYMRHALETNHFIAFAKQIRKARSIFNNHDVAKIIQSEYGKEFYSEIVDRIKVIADGGRSNGEGAVLLGKLFRYWIPSKIALNLSSFAKQIAGSVSYMNNIPVKDYINGVKDSFSDPLFAEFTAEVQNSDYFKNRMAGAMNRDLFYALKSTVNNSSAADMYGSYLLEKSTYLTRKGDAISVLRGGYAVFKYHYQKALADGADTKSAWETAMQKFRRATDETQQSGYLKDQNFFQSQSGFYRYFTAFLSNPTSIMNLELELIDDIRFGKGTRKAAAKQKLARQLFINHILLPALMTAITQFFRHGRDYDEYEWEDFAIASMLGPFEGLFIGGKIAAAAADTVYDLFAGGFRYQQSYIDAAPVLSDALNGMYRVGRLVKADELTSDNMFSAVQGLADIGTAAGSVAPVPNLGTVSAAASAVLREVKRAFRLGKNLSGMDEEKKKKIWER